MTEEELIERVKRAGDAMLALEEAVKLIEQLVATNEAMTKERDEAMQLLKTLSNMNGDLSRDLYKTKLLLAKAEAGLREIAAEASVPVHTWKNGINFKKMYEGWRKIAVERIDIARATLAEIKAK